MARTKRIIKFKDSVEYNFIFFDKGLTFILLRVMRLTMVGLGIFKKRLN